ncbi:MAG: response regulator transcription factor [Bdellovibrionales bacterium]
MMKSILLVEDDHSLGPLLKERLNRHYQVTLCSTKKIALQEIEKSGFDLAILDVGLPDGSGFDIGEHLKQKTKTPILFLTAQGDAESRLKGYELGAEEYVPKPFHLKELLIRIEHVLQSHPVTHHLVLEDSTIFFNEKKVKRKSGEIEFPPLKDLQLLELLIQKSPDPVSRDQILDEVWGPEKDLNTRTIDNAIVRLKRLLGGEDEKYIRSVRGLGYQWIYMKKEDL